MQKLEQQIWNFLMSNISSENCHDMYDLATKFDNPSLKLSAMNYIQQNDYNANIAFTHDLIHEKKSIINPTTNIIKNGLIGPGDATFYHHSGRVIDSIFDNIVEVDEPESIPSVLSTNLGFEESDTNYHSQILQHVRPDNLQQNASATEVIQAWSNKLDHIYKNAMLSQLQDDIDFNYNKADEINWEKELKRFYLSIKMLGKIDQINEIVETWKGKEDQMISNLILKYKHKISPSLLHHLNLLLNLIENEPNQITEETNDNTRSRFLFF